MSNYRDAFLKEPYIQQCNAQAQKTPEEVALDKAYIQLTQALFSDPEFQKFVDSGYKLKLNMRDLPFQQIFPGMEIPGEYTASLGARIKELNATDTPSASSSLHDRYNDYRIAGDIWDISIYPLRKLSEGSPATGPTLLILSPILAAYPLTWIPGTGATTYADWDEASDKNVIGKDLAGAYTVTLIGAEALGRIPGSIAMCPVFFTGCVLPYPVSFVGSVIGGAVALPTWLVESCVWGSLYSADAVGDLFPIFDSNVDEETAIAMRAYSASAERIRAKYKVQFETLSQKYNTDALKTLRASRLQNLQSDTLRELQTKYIHALRNDPQIKALYESRYEFDDVNFSEAQNENMRAPWKKVDEKIYNKLKYFPFDN